MDTPDYSDDYTGPRLSQKYQQYESDNSHAYTDDTLTVTMYLAALVVAIGMYYVLRHYKINLVMTTTNGTKTFDETRAVVISVMAGILVLLAFRLFR